MTQKSLKYYTAGELAALYILVMRGLEFPDTPAEIQDMLDSLLGDNLTIEAIRTVRSAIDSI